MNTLEECREQIDVIDTKIVALFEQRMKVVEEVVKFKKENNIPVTDFNREAIMLDKNLSKLSVKEYKEYYHYVLEGFLLASKAMQNDLVNK